MHIMTSKSCRTVVGGFQYSSTVPIFGCSLIFCQVPDIRETASGTCIGCIHSQLSLRLQIWKRWNVKFRRPILLVLSRLLERQITLAFEALNFVTESLPRLASDLDQQAGHESLERMLMELPDWIVNGQQMMKCS